VSEEESRNGTGKDLLSDESGIIVFGGGSGCLGRGCLFWLVASIVLSVTLTVLLNLAYFLF